MSEARDREAAPAVRLRVLPDAAALAAAAAEDVAQTVRRKPDATLLLPTGTTPLGMYRWLVEKYSSGDISFSRTTFFNLDEYLGLRPDHPASYRVYMQENFYGLVDADPERVHVPDGSASDPQAECEKYESLIQGSGGVDLCVLGIGRNGHIGFNEPGASRGSRTRVVRLADSTRRVNATDFDGGLAPQRAISVGMRTIYESEEVLLLASGANKAQAVAAAARGEISPEVPASMLRDHPCASFLLDADAASALDWEGT